ncbi:ABC transporter permease [Nannocystis sp. ILAH1]|uniref:ABC transporter permease n=1 Tax=unclassified Nannocystis TaxID=2627009 RepID=UPI00226F4845|nr:MULTISPECIES: ABC transporter permease [unclassified Nannocystis]MCY0991007.1 ABC transporter permease [Nannocystis sp. ILAH1]MCY1064512.1 ABC transporter permease [Nannocystis sp. RBIL2]
MNSRFVDAFCCEWLKKRRSLGAWLVVAGAFFTPGIVTLARLIRREHLPTLYAAPEFWTSLWRSSWESMAVFFVPMAAILTTSLVVQIEVRNNCWKQVHALPLEPHTIFLAKFAVIVLMLVQFFLLFDLGIYLSALLPWLLVAGVPYPQASLPLGTFVGDTALYFVDCLPIVAAQYLMSLRFANFLAPIGIGFLAWVGALGVLSWQHANLVPYAYTMLDYLGDNPAARTTAPTSGLQLFALAWFVLLTVAGYVLFATRTHKG